MQQSDAQTAQACARCARSIDGDYFEVNGKTACPTCCGMLAREHATEPGRESLIDAIVRGVGAGAATAAGHYFMVALIEFESAALFTATGLLVGYAVRSGSHDRGGARFQLIAIVLAYLAIIGSYLPFAVSASGWSPGLFILLLLPFLGEGAHIVNWFMIGIGLYLAWYINRRTPLQIAGPFKAGELNAPPAPDPEAA